MKDNNLATLLGFKKEEDVRCACEGYNSAITELEQLSPDVERLAAILYKTKGGESSSLTDTDRLMIMEECYREAKLTINSIPEWVVRKV